MCRSLLRLELTFAVLQSDLTEQLTLGIDDSVNMAGSHAFGSSIQKCTELCVILNF